MKKLIAQIKAKISDHQFEKSERRIQKFVEEYNQKNKLQQIILDVDSLSTSTGAGLYDYTLLHSYIRERKPTYILECGTGKSTWILADALKKNFEEFGIKGKLISMENIHQYYTEACNNLPKEIADFVEIHFSELEDYSFSIFTGNSYKNIPEYPYEFIFIDGPDDPYVGEYTALKRPNMDLIKLLHKTTNPITAVIDYRLPTVIAYGIVFGKKKVQFLKPWNIGLIENITKNDILISKENMVQMQILKDVATYEFKQPSWINV
jgi:predicted O-methyltransferase YrrM